MRSKKRSGSYSDVAHLKGFTLVAVGQPDAFPYSRHEREVFSIAPRNTQSKVQICLAPCLVSFDTRPLAVLWSAIIGEFFSV